MKILLNIIAWLGMLFFILLTIVLFIQSSAAMMAEPGTVGALLFSPESAFIFSLIGLILILIGGLTSKPRFFWIVCIVAGSLYIISQFYFYTFLPDKIEHGYIYQIFKDMAFSLIPGLVVIIEGIWLRALAKQTE